MGRTILWLIIVLSFFTAFKSQNTVLAQNNILPSQIKLSDREIKYIYHEATRRILFERYVSITSMENLMQFYSDENRSCGNQNIEIIVADKTDNNYTLRCLDFNNIEVINKFESEKVLWSMDFNFQPKIYFASIIDSSFSFSLPIVAIIEFSDILIGKNNKFYVSTFLLNRIDCDVFNENLYWSTNYTFEIEKCESGFLRFKRIIDGYGEVSSSLGPIPTIKILKDTEDCR